MSSGEKPIRGVVQSKESANGSGVLFRWALVNDGKHYKTAWTSSELQAQHDGQALWARVKTIKRTKSRGNSHGIHQPSSTGKRPRDGEQQHQEVHCTPLKCRPNPTTFIQTYSQGVSSGCRPPQPAGCPGPASQGLARSSLGRSLPALGGFRPTQTMNGPFAPPGSHPEYATQSTTSQPGPTRHQHNAYTSSPFSLQAIEGALDGHPSSAIIGQLPVAPRMQPGVGNEPVKMPGRSNNSNSTARPGDLATAYASAQDPRPCHTHNGHHHGSLAPPARYSDGQADGATSIIPLRNMLSEPGYDTDHRGAAAAAAAFTLRTSGCTHQYPREMNARWNRSSADGVEQRGQMVQGSSSSMVAPVACHGGTAGASMGFEQLQHSRQYAASAAVSPCNSMAAASALRTQQGAGMWQTGHSSLGSQPSMHQRLQGQPGRLARKIPGASLYAGVPSCLWPGRDSQQGPRHLQQGAPAGSTVPGHSTDQGHGLQQHAAGRAASSGYGDTGQLGGSYLAQGNQAAGLLPGCDGTGPLGDIYYARGNQAAGMQSLAAGQAGQATPMPQDALQFASAAAAGQVSSVHCISGQPQQDVAHQQHQQQRQLQHGISHQQSGHCSQQQNVAPIQQQRASQQQQQFDVVLRLVEDLRQRGMDPAAVEALWQVPGPAVADLCHAVAAGPNGAVLQQVASAAVEPQLAASGAAAAAASAPQAAPAAASVSGADEKLDYWTPCVSAAAAAIAAVAGGTDPAVAAQPGLAMAAARVACLGLKLLHKVPASAWTADPEDAAADLSYYIQEDSPDSSAEMNNSTGRVLVPSEVNDPVLEGKHIVLLGTRGEGAYAEVHVGLAAAPDQIVAAEEALQFFRDAPFIAAKALADAAAQGCPEQGEAKCIDIITSTAQQMVAAMPGALLEAVKIWKAVGDWVVVAQHEVVINQVLSSDAECRELVPKLLGVGNVVGNSWEEQQQYSSSTDAATASSMSQDRGMVMEYCPCTLHDYLQARGPLPEPQFKTGMQRLIKLLSRCQSGELVLPDGSGARVIIVNRDLKGSNMLLDNNGSSKVGDWGGGKMIRITAADSGGLAAAAAGGKQHRFAPVVQMRTQVGTPLYMASEVMGDRASQRNGGYDSSVDCFGVGIIGLEMRFGGYGNMYHAVADLTDAEWQFAGEGLLEANYPRYLQQLEKLAAGDILFPGETQPELGMTTFRDFLRRACGLGCPRSPARWLLEHPWLDLTA